MKKTAALAAFALGCLALAGCGGGGEDAVAPAQSPTAATAPAAAGAQTQGPTSMESVAFSPGKSVPKVLSDSLAAKKPVVVLFYMKGPVDDGLVLKEVQGLRTKYGNRVTFLIYQYKETVAYGSLADDLKATSTPSLTIIDGNGLITDQWIGYVDGLSVEQALFEALTY